MSSSAPTADPVIVLGEADLDVIELVLGGAVAAIDIPDVGGPVVLSDEQNTPIAQWVPHARGSGGTPTPLGARAHRTGPAWDPDLRRPAQRVREEIAGAGVRAVVFRDAPSRADLLRPEVRAPGPVAWVALTSSERRAGVLDDNALVTAVMAARPDGAIGLVVPAASTARLVSATLDVDEVLRAYGVESVVEVPVLRRDLPADAELDELYPPTSAAQLSRLRRPHGTMVLLTGLSGSGKSTLARALVDRLEGDDRRAVLLDGDEVRQLLSSELGFDRASRELNLQRIGYVGSLVVRVGGVAVAAPIAPFAASRDEIRARVQREGDFLLVHVATPLEVCEARDRKGLYARARAGELDDFTGISSPYEVPDDADVVVDTSRQSVAEAVDAIAAALRGRFEPGR